MLPKYFGVFQPLCCINSHDGKLMDQALHTTIWKDMEGSGCRGQLVATSVTKLQPFSREERFVSKPQIFDGFSSTGIFATKRHCWARSLEVQIREYHNLTAH